MAEVPIRKKLGLLGDQHTLVLEQCSFGQDTYPSKLANPTYLLEHLTDDYIEHLINLNPNPKPDAILLSIGSQNIINFHCNLFLTRDRICSILSLINRQGLKAFFLPILPRINLLCKEQTYGDPRSPWGYKTMGSWISDQVAEYGTAKLGYDPVVPIRFPLDVSIKPVDKGIYLTFKSYQNISAMTGALVDFAFNLPPHRLNEAHGRTVSYYEDQRLKNVNWRDGVWIGARYDTSRRSPIVD